MTFFDLIFKKSPDISALTSRNDIAGLIKALRSKDFTIQTAAAKALGTLGVQAMDELIRALQKNNTDTRLGIIEALSVIRDPQSVQPLINVLKDENSEIRWEAAIALGEIGDERATDPLVHALRDTDKYVRYGASFALAKIGWKPPDAVERAFLFIGMQEWKAAESAGPSAIPALSHVLNDRDANVRKKAIEILGNIGDKEAIPAIMRGLADENSEVRWQAVLSAPRCGVSMMHLPRGLSRRPRTKKNPLIAGFLNFMLPGLGYGYLGKWYGVMIFQIDITATVWLFKYEGETSSYGMLFPIYLLLAIHAWYITRKMPDF